MELDSEEIEFIISELAISMKYCDTDEDREYYRNRMRDPFGRLEDKSGKQPIKFIPALEVKVEPVISKSRLPELPE